MVEAAKRVSTGRSYALSSTLKIEEGLRLVHVVPTVTSPTAVELANWSRRRGSGVKNFPITLAPMARISKNQTIWGRIRKRLSKKSQRAATGQEVWNSGLRVRCGCV